MEAPQRSLFVVLLAAAAAWTCHRSPEPEVPPQTTANTAAHGAPTDPPPDDVGLPNTPSPEAAPPADPPSAVVLEFLPCRSTPAVRRLALSHQGVVTFSDGSSVERSGSVSVAEVKTLVAQLMAAGVADWGDSRCSPSDSTRCSMHPCLVKLTVATDDGEHAASTDDASRSSAFARAVAQVQRVAKSWRWLDPGLDPDAAGPCEAAHECTLIEDSCKGLHSALVSKPKARVSSGDCAQSIFPKKDVEPTCDAGRCALLPVAGDSRACLHNPDCSPVNFCGSWGAIRRDKVKRVGLKNDHRACPAPSVPPPRVACLRGVCVTRGP